MMQMLNLISRDEWGAGSPSRGLPSHKIDRITLHHTAVPFDERPTSERLRAYQRYHQQQGWPDIAYHLVVGVDGLIYEGRALDSRGDSATGYDTEGHLLVAVDGDFTREHPSREQREALVALLEWAIHQYALDATVVRGHSTYAATACPGEHLLTTVRGWLAHK